MNPRLEWLNRHLNYPRTTLAILHLWRTEYQYLTDEERALLVDREVTRAVEERRRQVALAIDRLMAEGDYSSAQLNALRDAYNEVFRLVLQRLESQKVEEVEVSECLPSE